MPVPNSKLILDCIIVGILIDYRKVFSLFTGLIFAQA